MDPDGSITLLDKGREIAEKIYERHTLLSDWLTILGVSPEVAVKMRAGSSMLSATKAFGPLKPTRKNISRISLDYGLMR